MLSGWRVARLNCMPALTIVPEMTALQFSEKFPDGADYVIVPALHNPKSPDGLAWIQQQRTSNATIIGICAGALPLAYAGLLDRKRATTSLVQHEEIDAHQSLYDLGQ